MTKTFTRAGVSTLNGVVTYRFANDVNRETVLSKHGHTDIRLFELGEAMTKESAIQFLNAMGIVADVNAPRVKAAKPVAVDEPTVNTEAVRNEMLEQAAKVAEDKLQQIGGDRFACGFAWVNVYPKHKGNTRAGKAERKVLEEMGFRKDWTGKAYEFWNPSQWPGQNIDVKEAGARAAAEVLRKYGFTAYAGSRLD
jgi:hypothetical protein